MKRESPAAQRNREPIAEALAPLLPPRGTVLEVASGSGEHAVHLARRFPHLLWQPSDPDGEARASIALYVKEAGLPNLRPPVALDAAGDAPFPPADAVLCINMIHIAPWEACEGLLRKAPGGSLFLYSPFVRDGVPTAPSNIAFDADLRARDPRWGVRRLEDVAALAAQHGWGPPAVTGMPANNLLVAFRR
ncbi:DUF938 domain-containing protein [Sabulicella glaciei]|uniref:Class I SAM-dependent methyltransferase n=1 Tax=Sabulicella glaciei TaxID=2984948 RepID=A0ABT3NX22_9PROT|nr:class I SAM-dependent methyltransferase [Roseococcus sp. MDT2-1-1]